MNKYEEAAVRAAKLCQTSKITSPTEAWRRVTIRLFGEGTSGQIKGCPRDTFLGLCEDGLTRDVAKGPYTRSIKNKAYGTRAVKLLQENPKLALNIAQLWYEVVNGNNKKHNAQMNVVVALWNSNLIVY